MAEAVPSLSPAHNAAGTLQEFDQLTELLSQIPHKVQRALKMQHELLEMTCLDANQYFVAIGSNIGTVFLYDRDKHTIQRLKSENAMDSSACVALHHGLDDMVGVGYISGALYIFQLPSNLLGHSKQLERFIVMDLHITSLTALTWSTNGMKLFSGDNKGSVGCTEVDFEAGKCASSMLLIENNTVIVQLQQGHRSLLVSTKHRCLVCRMDQHDRLLQIGSKDRKITGDFGACFIPGMCKPDDAQLYASRPGYRLWKASIGGTVTNTFMYKDVLSANHSEILIQPFNVLDITRPKNGNQFGRLLMFRDKQLVTWNDVCLYVLDPESMSVVGLQTHIGNIVSAVVTESDEIFVLRAGTDRNVIRLAAKPLPKSSAKLLRQLQTERQEEEKKAQQQQGPNEDGTTTVPGLENNEEKKQTKEKASPFKFLQENIVDKVKQIPKPTEIKDKIQEKLKLDNNKTELPPSKYNQSYTFNDSNEKTFPSGELPPVVQLASPDLLKIELSGEFPQDENVTVEPVTPSDRFSVLSGSCSLETELHHTDRPPRMGTGAQSALSRLQEDHQSEIMGKSVYEIAKNTDGEITLTVEKEEDLAVVDAEDDDIVFSRKAKVKHKKKKGSKDKYSKTKELDTLSTASTSSTGSGATDNQSRLTASTDSRTLGESDNQSNLTVDSGTMGETEITDDLHTSLCEGIEELDKLVVTGEMLPDTVDEYEDDKVDSAVTERKSVEGSVDTLHSVDAAEETKIPQHVSEIPAHGDESRDNKIDVTNTDKTEMSNLDKEIERLDEFLGDRPVEQPDSVMKTSFDERISKGRNFMDTMVLGKAQNKNMNIEYSDKDYTPSSLERELQKLEQSSEVDRTDVFNTPLSPGEISSPESQAPSIYSIYRKPSTPIEDIYSRYNPASPTDSSPSLDSQTDSIISSATASVRSDDKHSLPMNEFGHSFHITEIPKSIKSFNVWSEIPAPTNMYSLSASRSHVWFTDRSQNIYYSPVSQSLLTWKKASGSGSQISVSRDGNIVWCLRKNTVYAGTKITAKRPEGLKWVSAVKDVEYVCVDETCAWYIKTSGEVMMQKGLSRDRPCYTAQQVDCSKRLRQIVCQSGVVWGVTDTCQWYYRDGITSACPEGTAWKSGDSGGVNHLFSSISLGDGNVGWAIDVVGQVWFCTGVTMETPCGDGTWWQVPLNREYLMKDMSMMDMLKSFTKNFDPQKLATLVSAQSGGLISGIAGIWVCPEYKHMLYGCRGNIEGQQWRDGHPVQMSSSSSWKLIEAINSDRGLTWALQPSGDLFAFTPDQQLCYNVEKPREFKATHMFVCISACSVALWGLTFEGHVFIRRGITTVDPKGSDWHKLDLSQIEYSHIVHVSCGLNTVWAVDADGNVFHRIGVKAPSDNTLNAAWLPVDNGGTVFTKVVTGNQEWKVWAIDNRRQVYVRSDITNEMPIGRRWIHVSGTPATDLTVSDNFVWALNQAGELLCRYGVSEDNVAGDYWKKLPGTLTHMSASPSDVLWGINGQGQLVRRHTKYIVKKSSKTQDKAEDESRTRDTSVGSDDGDWTLI